MEKILLLLVSLIIFRTASAQSSNCIFVDGEIAVYWQDTVQISDYSVVQSGINEHRFIVFNQNEVLKRKNNYKYWNDPDCIIYLGNPLDILDACKNSDTPLTQALWESLWP